MSQVMDLVFWFLFCFEVIQRGFAIQFVKQKGARGPFLFPCPGCRRRGCTQWGTHSEGRGPAAHELSLFADTEPPNPVLPVSDVGDTSPSPGAVVAEASAQLEAPRT